MDAGLLAFIFSFFSFLSISLVAAQDAFAPAGFPLVLKSPYSNAWFNARSGAQLNQWPSMSDLDQRRHVQGFIGVMRVDGSAFQWLGTETADIANFSTISGLSLTPTQTTLKATAGGVEATIHFTSPIEPSDLALHSFPFTYVHIDVRSVDGASHRVQFYTDVTGEWISNSFTTPVRWSTTQTTEGSVYHQMKAQSPKSMIEAANIAEDSEIYIGTSMGQSVSFQTGGSKGSRAQFRSQGVLTGAQDTKFRNIIDDFPVLSLAKDVGAVSGETLVDAFVFAIGVVRDPAVSYLTKGGSEPRRSLFWAKYKTMQIAFDAFLAGFSAARDRANALDTKLMNEARAISSNYADLVAVSTRIALAGVEITGPANGEPRDNSDILAFVKDMGSSQRTNPVEVLYAALPAFMYFNVSWGGHLLRPLLRQQSEIPSGKPYALPDLGSSFPQVLGNSNSSVSRGLDDSSSMLIMGWAHAKFSGDKGLISQYYPLFKSWAEFMSQNTLTPSGFVNSDGFDRANQTNLAIKGIIGLRAMAEISAATGQPGDASQYKSRAETFVQQWKALAGSRGHLQSTYDSPQSWALVYNLFPDVWLGFNLVDRKTYDSQTQWYNSMAGSAAPFGLPYDSNQNNAGRSHWTMLTAATIKDVAVRNRLVDMVYSRVRNNRVGGVIATRYSLTDGATEGGVGSPAHGAMFSLLAVNMQAKLASANIGAPSKTPPVGAIVGGVVGGVAMMAILLILFLFIRRRRRRQQSLREKYRESILGDLPPEHEVIPYEVSSLQSMQSPPDSGYTGLTSITASYYHGPSTDSGTTRTFQTPQAPPLPSKAGSSISSPQRQRSQRSLNPNDSISNVSSGTENQDLRREVDHLRQQMNELREREAYGVYEAPPTYG